MKFKNEMGTIKMNKGQKITIGGFLTAIVGILVYSLANFFSDQLQGQALPFMTKDGLEVLSLTAIGVGVLAWLIGQFIHMNSIIDQKWKEDSK